MKKTLIPIAALALAAFTQGGTQPSHEGGGARHAQNSQPFSICQKLNRELAKEQKGNPTQGLDMGMGQLSQFGGVSLGQYSQQLQAQRIQNIDRLKKAKQRNGCPP